MEGVPLSLRAIRIFSLGLLQLERAIVREFPSISLSSSSIVFGVTKWRAFAWLWEFLQGIRGISNCIVHEAIGQLHQDLALNLICSNDG